VIDGHTQLVGLLGWPVEHSLSPAMHNAAFDALGLNWRYVPLPVAPGQVEAAVKGVAALGFRGVNVTVPHKQAVMAALDSVAPDAARFGAVNTIVIERGADGKATLSGYNTDYKGFTGALRRGGFDPAGKRAVIVGAGGVARAAVFALLAAGIVDILLFDIAPQQVQALIADMGSHRAGTSPAPTLRTLPQTPETLVESARAADLLVNATPLGMWPKVEGSVWPEAVPIPPHLAVFDMVYNPQETRLLRQAREAGAQPIGGLGMLVEQGALAFEMWTGQPAPVELMASVCEQALRR
jgi:shikimate dehydrogenase